MTCVACNAQLSPEQAFCDACGAPQPAPMQSRAPIRQVTALTPGGVCISCGRDPGIGQACLSCRHVTGFPVGVNLTTPGRRLGAHILEIVLFGLTLGVGWLIWVVFVTAKQGQSPAKQLLNIRVIKVQSHAVAGWTDMFLREVIYKTVIAVFTFTFAYFWLLFDKNNQQLWDKMGATLVVDDPQNTLRRTVAKQAM